MRINKMLYLLHFTRPVSYTHLDVYKRQSYFGRGMKKVSCVFSFRGFLISGMKIGQTKFVFSGFRLHKALVL